MFCLISGLLGVGCCVVCLLVFCGAFWHTGGALRLGFVGIVVLWVCLIGDFRFNSVGLGLMFGVGSYCVVCRLFCLGLMIRLPVWGLLLCFCFGVCVRFLICV